MGVIAGQIATAGRMPGERIATRILVADSDSTTGTSELEVASVTAPLVAGRTYRVSFYGHVNSSVGTDESTPRLHEDDISTPDMQSDRTSVDGSTTSGRKTYMEAEHVATATGPKTFALGLGRAAGTGNTFIEAASTRPAYLTVDYIRG